MSPIKSRALPPLLIQRLSGTGKPILSFLSLIDRGSWLENATRNHRLSSPSKNLTFSGAVAANSTIGWSKRERETRDHAPYSLYLQPEVKLGASLEIKMGHHVKVQSTISTTKNLAKIFNCFFSPKPGASRGL